MARVTYTPEERQAKVDAAHERLAAGVRGLIESDSWQAWLAVAARFHRHSARNTLLIWCQRPDATHVAGFHQWKEFGRSVKKGAKGIAIFAPVTRKADEDETAGAASPAARRVVGFKVAHVFDVSDTEGDDLPEPVTPTLLEGEAPAGMVEALSAQVAAAGFTIERRPECDSPGANGETDFARQTVTLATEGRSEASQARTLAHELAHVLLHGGPRSAADRGRRECEAESVAFLVADAYGLAGDAYAFGYVAGWSGGSPEKVLQVADTVRSTAAAILAAAGVTGP